MTILLTFLAVFFIILGFLSYNTKLIIFQETHKTQNFFWEIILISTGITILLN